jgi:hypothetical protein
LADRSWLAFYHLDGAIHRQDISPIHRLHGDHMGNTHLVGLEPVGECHSIYHIW